MTSGPGPRPVPPAPRIAIRHSSPWHPDRHVPAFLRPIIDGIRRRLAANHRPLQ